jgi:phosphatidate cytidylyltransferase
VRLAGVGGVAARSFVAWAAAAPLLAAYAPEVWLWSVPVFVVAVSLVTPAGSERADALPRLALGACYLPFLIPLLWFVRAADPVHWFAIGFAVALADVAAFVAGSMLGGRRLAPTLSPNKTWSGVAGAALGAAAGLGVAAVIFETGYGVGPALLIALPVTAAAVWGDLFESGLKRAAGVKDAGTLLPGFGGVLDRIDSLLFAAPAYLACLHFIGWVS